MWAWVVVCLLAAACGCLLMMFLDVRAENARLRDVIDSNMLVLERCRDYLESTPDTSGRLDAALCEVCRDVGCRGNCSAIPNGSCEEKRGDWQGGQRPPAVSEGDGT